MKDRPDDWGNDPLTRFLEDHFRNQLATFDNLQTEIRDLISIDDTINTIVKGLVDPDPWVPALFLTRAHSAFRAAVASAMAGQIHEAQPVLRLSLEQAAYAVYVGADVAKMETWLRRDESADARQKVRRMFHAKTIEKYLTTHDRRIGDAYTRLYERMIELGAHPNEGGMTMSLRLKKEGTVRRYEAVYLHAEEPLLKLGVRHSTQVGVFLLMVCQSIYPRIPFDPEFTGKFDELLRRY